MKRIILTSLFVLIYWVANSQNIRTFTNFELSSSFSTNTNQFSVYWGESLQLKSPVPVRFLAGLRYSLNGKATGNYLWSSAENNQTESLVLVKSSWYHTFAIPVGLEFYFKNLSVGGFHEIISMSGKKDFTKNFASSSTTEKLNTLGFSNVFHTKNNLTGGIYVAYTFSDSFSLKLGYNRISSTFTKSNNAKEIAFSKIKDDTFSIGLRLNIEK